MNALLESGFHVHHRGHGFTLLRRGGRLVLVPSVGTLSPEMMDAILRSAGLSASELETHLPPAPSRSGTYPRTRQGDGPPSSTGHRGR
jgi:hypothetical protein